MFPLRHLLTICAISMSPSLFALSGTFVASPDRVDVIHDAARDAVYITSQRSVLRYSLGSDSFLPEWRLDAPDATASRSLKGLDLSPDGRTLAVADAAHSATESWIWLIDTDSGASQRVRIALEPYEGGTYSVAYGNDGSLFVSSSFEGSGWTRLRRVDPVSGTVSTIALGGSFGDFVTQDCMLTASGDATHVGFEESNNSAGGFGRIRVGDLDVIHNTGYGAGTNWYNYEIGVNADGTQYAIPTYNGTYIADAALNKTNDADPIGNYAGSQPIGVAYDPVRPLVYFAWTQSSEVRAHETSTFAQSAAWDVGYTFGNTGNHGYQQGRLKLSRDGSLLMVTVGDPWAGTPDGRGVRVVRLYSPLVAGSQQALAEANATTSVTLSGSIGIPATLTYTISQGPTHGTLTGAPPNVTYEPEPDYAGADSFTFDVHYGRATAAGTVAIDVDHRPQASDASLTVAEDSQLNAVPSASDADGDSLTYTIVSGPAHGTLSGSAPNLVFSPAANYNGPDQFTFTASDGKLTSNVATVSISVAAVNDAPIALNDAASTRKGTSVTIPVAANDVDVDGDPLVIASVTKPVSGNATISGTSIVYTPKMNFTGIDTFTYRVSDGHGGTATATVSVTVVKR